MKDMKSREDGPTGMQAQALIESMALALGLEVVQDPGDGNCFSFAVRYVLL